MKGHYLDIPHKNDDQDIVRLWHNGLKASRITEEINKSVSHVDNRLRELRKELQHLVLTNKARIQYNSKRKI